MSQSVAERPFLTRQQAAEFLNVSKQTLAIWAMTGKGPRVIPFGTRMVRYSKTDLLKWAEQCASGGEKPRRRKRKAS